MNEKSAIMSGAFAVFQLFQTGTGAHQDLISFRVFFFLLLLLSCTVQKWMVVLVDPQIAGCGRRNCVFTDQ